MDVFRIEWHCKSSSVLLEDGLQWKYVQVTNLHLHEHSKVCILNFHILYIKFNIRRSFRDLQISLNLTSDVAFVIYRTTYQKNLRLGFHWKIYYIFPLVIYRKTSKKLRLGLHKNILQFFSSFCSAFYKISQINKDVGVIVTLEID